MRIVNPLIPPSNGKRVPRARVVLPCFLCRGTFGVLFLRIGAVVNLALIKDCATVGSPHWAARTRRNLCKAPRLAAIERQYVNLRDFVAFALSGERYPRSIRRPSHAALSG